MKKTQQINKEKMQLPHPRDRKVRQLQRKEKRFLKLESRKQVQVDARIQRAMRFLWFRTQCLALGYHTKVPVDDVPILVQLYVDRHEDELRQLKALNSPPAGRIKEIEALHAKEKEMFTNSGFEVPILTSSDDFEILTEIWDGIPETASVLTAEFVKLPSTGLNENRKQELKNKLTSLDEVRQSVVKVLPHRYSKKAIENSHRLRAKKSVKKMGSMEEVQQRTLTKGKAKRDMQRKQEVRATLSKMREKR